MVEERAADALYYRSDLSGVCGYNGAYKPDRTGTGTRFNYCDICKNSKRAELASSFLMLNIFK